MSAYKLSKAYDQYGSSMGRKDSITEPLLATKFHLQQLSIDRGGYDSGGAYWGIGPYLWIAYADGTEEEQRVFVRAWNRGTAKHLVRSKFKNAKFFR